jgi:feruloyl esterase
MIRSTMAFVALLSAAVLGSSPAAAATPCANLTALTLPNNTKVDTATVVPAGPFVRPGATTATNVPEFCRVAGTSRPTSDSEIHFEVWMPARNWNGKFDHGGNGGYGGSLGTPGGFMLDGLLRGYATAGTDMGHNAAVFPGGSFALGHPEKLADWGYRANHVTSVAAKLIIRAYYGTPAFLNYFTGCSDGGHEALMEAQRFPDDYDGIVAGAPANYWTHQSAAWVWEALAGLGVLPTSKLPLINAAAVAACPGIVPTVIDDPTSCRFDPASLLCAGADAAGCLTAAQVDAVRKIYAGPRNPRTGARIYPGLERGSEAAEGSLGAAGSWSILVSSAQTFLGGDTWKYMVFQNPSWDFHTLDFDKDVALADRTVGPIINSTSPDLSDFRALGGKMIIWHGWADPLVNPRNSIDYVRSVAAAGRGKSGKEHDDDEAASGTQGFLRLFMAAGLTHCSGGPGLTTFDTLTALERWVEQGKAPDKLIASHTTLAFPDNVMSVSPPAGDFSRPLCPWPQVARYVGKGSKTDARSFVCARQSSDRDDDD